VAPPALVSDVWAIHDYTSIAPGAINDRLARVALEPARRATLLARTRGIIRANYPLVRRWIEQQDGLSHVPPDAGAIVFVRHTHPFRSSDLTDRLRQERSVLLVPGDYFDMDGYLRIGFGSDPKYLESALSLIGEFLSSVGAHAR
jgi:aspartate/methionine/tyrosine aminotransferase